MKIQLHRNWHFLALMVAAPLKILCFFGTQIYGIFSQKICTIYCLIVGMFTSICSNMLNCWPSTPISRLPASQRPKQPIFLEQAQAPAWIVRWGWMARETARLENLPQTSGNFRLARWEDSALTILSVAGVATWQVSVDLKAHRTKQLDGLEQVCQCVWSPWKKEPPVRSLQLVSTMSRICAQNWVFALKGHVEINLTLSKGS